MAITFTVLGTNTNTAGTAVSTTVSTVAGRLYAVVAHGSYETFLGGSYSGLTISGVTATQRSFGSRASRHDCLVQISTFVGAGGSETITNTMSGLSGSPRWPVVAVSVIEVTGSSSTNRVANTGSDGNTAASVSHAASYVTGNRALGAMSLAFYATGGTIAPSGGATEIVDGLITDSSGGGAGYGFANGNNLAYQTQWVDSITSSVTFSQDDYGEALVIVEFVADSGATGTIAGTQDAHTSSIDGLVGVVGTIAGVEADDTSSITGTETISGTIGATEDDDTSSITGLIGATGTIAGTQDAQTSSIAGTETIGGTIGATQDAHTSSISGAGASDPTGTIGGAQDAHTSSITGVIGAVGTIGATQDAHTSSIAGTETIAGTITATQDAQTSAITGTAGSTNVTGSIDGQQQAQVPNFDIKVWGSAAQERRPEGIIPKSDRLRWRYYDASKNPDTSPH